MLGVVRSLVGSRFLRRSIASTSYRNVSAAAAQESQFVAGKDILWEQRATEEDRVVIQKLNQVLIDAKKANRSPGEALKTYNGPFTLEGISRIMKATRDIESARAIINWVSRQPGFYYTTRLMACILRGLNLGDQLDEAKKLVFEELHEKFKPTPSVYRCLAQLYMDAQNIPALEKLVEEMQRRGIEPCDMIFKFMMETKSKESGVKGMFEMFREKVASGWVPNRHIGDKLMFKLAESKMWPETLEVYNVIRSNGMHPDDTCMAKLMKELSHARKVDEAYTVTKHLLERGFNSTPPFDSVVNALVAAGRLDEAYEIFNGVYDRVTERVTFNGVHLVLAFCKAGDPDMAIKVLDRLKPPDREASYFKAVIALLCKRDRIEEARKMLDQMVEAGFSPGFEMCNLVKLPVDDPRRKKTVPSKQKKSASKGKEVS